MYMLSTTCGSLASGFELRVTCVCVCVKVGRNHDALVEPSRTTLTPLEEPSKDLPPPSPRSRICEFSPLRLDLRVCSPMGLLDQHCHRGTFSRDSTAPNFGPGPRLYSSSERSPRFQIEMLNF